MLNLHKQVSSVWVFLMFIYFAVLGLSCGAQAIYLWCVSSRAAGSGVAAEGLSYLGS